MYHHKCIKLVTFQLQWQRYNFFSEWAFNCSIFTFSMTTTSQLHYLLGNLSAAQTLDLISTQNYFLIDIRSEKDKNKAGVPRLPPSAKNKMISVPYELYPPSWFYIFQWISLWWLIFLQMRWAISPVFH